MPPEDITAEEMVSRLLYRDGLMLVVDKPAGIAVHRGPKGGESLEDYFGALRFGLPRAPALAHRLDRDTSAAWCSGATARLWRNLVNCSNRERSAKLIGRWSKAGPTATKGRSSCRWGGSMSDAAGG